MPNGRDELVGSNIIAQPPTFSFFFLMAPAQALFSYDMVIGSVDDLVGLGHVLTNDLSILSHYITSGNLAK